MSLRTIIYDRPM